MNCYSLRTANRMRQLEWNPHNIDIPPSFSALELAGETGEACNIIKKLERTRLGIAGGSTDYEAAVKHLATELADVIICCDLVAIKYGIELEEAVKAKFNATSEKVGLKTRFV